VRHSAISSLPLIRAATAESRTSPTASRTKAIFFSFMIFYALTGRLNIPKAEVVNKAGA
jgi:hypothetical protein